MYDSKLLIFPNGSIQFRSYSKIITTKEDRKLFNEVSDADFDAFLKDANKLHNPFDDSQIIPDYIPESFSDEQNGSFSASVGLDPEEAARKKAHSVRTATTRAKDKVMKYARSTAWEWFVTFTFDPEKVDSYDYDECKRKVNNWCRNMKSRFAPGFKYIIVPELHKSGRWHFHGLFANCGSISFSLAKKSDGSIAYGWTKKHSKVPLFNVSGWNFGFSTASKIGNIRKASYYIVKYMGKQLVEATHSGQRYFCSKNLDLPEIVTLTACAFGLDALYDVLSYFGLDVTIDYSKLCKGSYLDMFSFELSFV